VNRVEAWRPADGLTLEPNALLAAKEQGRCLALTAGPGAGKTEMLAQRADFLLRTGTCRYPRRILAISFKVDASRNLKDRVRRRCGIDLSSRFDSYTFHAFAKRIIDRFRPVLTGTDALNPDYKIGSQKIARVQIEFSDLVPLAVKILMKSGFALNAIRQTYSDVFLDEFQDCTGQQYELVRLAFQGANVRLTAVGDTKQKIMAWAGALDGIFATFASDFNAVPLNMYRNFRSMPRLLRMQNEVIRVLDPSSVMPDEQVVGNDGQVEIWNFENSVEEANALAEHIFALINAENIAPPEIAVLVSKQPELYVNHLTAALEARGIPFRNEQQLQDLSTEPAARLIVDYLSSIFGVREPAAWIRLMNFIVPFADEEVQANMRQDWQRFISAERRKALQVDLIDESFEARWSVVLNLLNKLGLVTLTALSPDYESRARLREVIRETKTRIEELLLIEADLPKALARFSDEQTVRILTIHKSKGLEFDTVIILGVEAETFWGRIAEERCAFFVGISRAKRRLIMTVSSNREKPPGANNRWNAVRTRHEEFLNYAIPALHNAS
jgi:superfamily I DNA/RNA helicase